MSESKPREQPHTTLEQDKVPIGQKLAIGFGEASSIGRQGIEHLALPIYNITLGVSPVLVGSVLGIIRFVDAITDPLAGWISDNSISRWGRRKPFMFAASIICGLIFPLIWFVPDGWSETAYAAYFFAALLVYYSAYSFFNVPLIALAFEATPDYHERTSVQAYKAFFVHSMGIISGWLFAITQLKAFDGTMDGARVAGLAVGATIIVVGLIPTLTVREGFGEVARREVAIRAKGLTFIEFIRFTLSNRPFLVVCVIQICMGVGAAIVGSYGIYILIYHVYAGDKLAAAILHGTWTTAYQTATIVSIPLIAWSAKKLGKISTLRLSLILLAVGSLSKWFVYTPSVPYLALLAVVALGPAQTAYYMIIRSIIADVCDHDELTTGMRREAAYGAMYSWIGKVDGSLGIFFAGLVLVWVGFDAELGGGQGPNTIFFMRLAFSGFPIVGAILALVALQFFPLTESRCLQNRSELEKRRGAVSAPNDSE